MTTYTANITLILKYFNFLFEIWYQFYFDRFVNGNTHYSYPYGIVAQANDIIIN